MKLIPFSALLSNGETALIREVGPADRHFLKVGFEHLSERSRNFRFLAAHPRLTQKELHQFTAPSDVDHVAIGALTKGGSEALPLGIARYIRLAKAPDVAEVAVTIVDSHQGIGLGSLILGVLAKHAVLNGISEFAALVHQENESMLGLFNRLDGRQTWLDGAEVEVKLQLFHDAADYPKSSVGNAFRNAYGLSQIE
ncbi:MAG: hypothetical protein WBB25_21230 [Sulfitobacter sp.]